MPSSATLSTHTWALQILKIGSTLSINGQIGISSLYHRSHSLLPRATFMKDKSPYKKAMIRGMKSTTWKIAPSDQLNVVIDVRLSWKRQPLMTLCLLQLFSTSWRRTSSRETLSISDSAVLTALQSTERAMANRRDCLYPERLADSDSDSDWARESFAYILANQILGL